MNFIIVIRCQSEEEYIRTKTDLFNQFSKKDMPIPFFAYLFDADYSSIEIVWIDEDVELEKFKKALNCNE